MQIQGVGEEHTSSMHQVTNCIHDHAVSKKTGAMGPVSSDAGIPESGDGVLQPEGQFSLAAWLKNTLSGSRRLLQRIWGDGTDAAAVKGSKGENLPKTQEQVMAQIKDADTAEKGDIGSRAAMASSLVQPQTLQNNPYFSAIEDTGREKKNLWEKARVRFQSVTGQLTKRFAGRNSFHTRQEKPKEDLRRHSRYREDDLEIDCILTDDSYLMDSYDSKGEYSKLSADKYRKS